MPAPGDRLGPYEILSLIGAGGMGEVFKARDTRLGRTVAIKVSSARFSERFEREARAVAALSHPNICTLYDVGPDYLVMEYIDGKPLKGPLPLEQALRYAREIATALDAAHRQGIVHRDLKPGNILVAKGGVKLLDFGLAKMTGLTPTASDVTVTQALTEQGTIVGTLQYMAPEQLEGKDADARSDIFAFGCVLYEMLTGRAAFEGQSKASIIAAILDREPQPLTGVPPAISGAIRRAMAKDPDDRWQSARDLAGVLDLAGAVPDAAPTVPAAPRRSMLPAIALLAAMAAALCGLAIWRFSRAAPEITWSGAPLGGPAQALDPRVSPDGHTIAFQAMIDGQVQVAILRPETGNWTVLTHQTDLGAIDDIAWSRDGAKLYFGRETDTPAGVYTVPVLGGEPRLVLEMAANPQVLADGSLTVLRMNAQRDLQLYRFRQESGKVEPLPAIVDSLIVPVYRATPDGTHIIFFGRPLQGGSGPEETGVYSMDQNGANLHRLASRIVLYRRSPLTSTPYSVAIAGAPDGKNAILGVQSRSLYRVIEVPLDGGSSERTLFTMTVPPANIDIAPDGTLYADQVERRDTLLRYSPNGGAVERLSGEYNFVFALIAVLHDGRPLVQTVAGNGTRLAIVQRDGSMSPLVESNEFCSAPAALAGDRLLAVMTDRPEIALVSISEGRIVSRVRLPQGQVNSLAASPDGKTLYYSSGGFIWSIPASGGEPAKITPGDSVAADPNGRDLVIAVTEKESVKLLRLPAAGGTPQRMEPRGDLRIPNATLTTGAVAPDGRIALYLASVRKWAYLAGLADPRAGAIAPIPLQYDGEIANPVWTPDGRIVASGRNYSFTLWRFQPAR